VPFDENVAETENTELAFEVKKNKIVPVDLSEHELISKYLSKVLDVATHQTPPSK
jgi:hypothetical protein